MDIRERAAHQYDSLLGKVIDLSADDALQCKAPRIQEMHVFRSLLTVYSPVTLFCEQLNVVAPPELAWRKPQKGLGDLLLLASEFARAHGVKGPYLSVEHVFCVLLAQNATESALRELGKDANELESEFKALSGWAPGQKNNQ